jgi:hypothetical protein
VRSARARITSDSVAYRPEIPQFPKHNLGKPLALLL